MSERLLEVEYTNDRHHVAFMTGQIHCGDAGAGRIVVELFDVDGQQRLELAAGAHRHAEADPVVASNTLTMPIPPRWSVKCYREETKSAITTSWAEID